MVDLDFICFVSANPDISEPFVKVTNMHIQHIQGVSVLLFLRLIGKGLPFLGRGH